jgi:hypothetical protein
MDSKVAISLVQANQTQFSVGLLFFAKWNQTRLGGRVGPGHGWPRPGRRSEPPLRPTSNAPQMIQAARPQEPAAATMHQSFKFAGTTRQNTDKTNAVFFCWMYISAPPPSSISCHAYYWQRSLVWSLDHIHAYILETSNIRASLRDSLYSFKWLK